MAGLKELYCAEHAQSSKPPLRKACRAQQQHSSDQYLDSSHQSSFYQYHSPDQHTGTSPEPGPDIGLLSLVLQRQWDHAKNGHLGDIVIKRYAKKKFWWRCDQCPDGHPHVWEASVHSRSRGASCPFCTNKKACRHNSLATKRPDIAAEFSLRSQGTAHDYTAGSGEQVFWQCKHGHEYMAPIFSRTSKNTGCPECFATCKSQPRQKHPVLTDSSRHIMQLWDSDLNDREGLDPKVIRCRSKQMCNWICHCCPKGTPHRWRARPGTLYDGHGCPCCSGRKACTCNSLQSLFPEVAAEWDYARNLGTPADYTAGSRYRAWWINGQRGNFDARVDTRTSVRKT